VLRATSCVFGFMAFIYGSVRHVRQFMAISVLNLCYLGLLLSFMMSYKFCPRQKLLPLGDINAQAIDDCWSTEVSWECPLKPMCFSPAVLIPDCDDCVLRCSEGAYLVEDSYETLKPLALYSCETPYPTQRLVSSSSSSSFSSLAEEQQQSQQHNEMKEHAAGATRSSSSSTQSFVDRAFEDEDEFDHRPHRRPSRHRTYEPTEEPTEEPTHSPHHIDDEEDGSLTVKIPHPDESPRLPMHAPTDGPLSMDEKDRRSSPIDVVSAGRREPTRTGSKKLQQDEDKGETFVPTKITSELPHIPQRAQPHLYVQQSTVAENSRAVAKTVEDNGRTVFREREPSSSWTLVEPVASAEKKKRWAEDEFTVYSQDGVVRELPDDDASSSPWPRAIRYLTSWPHRIRKLMTSASASNKVGTLGSLDDITAEYVGDDWHLSVLIFLTRTIMSVWFVCWFFFLYVLDQWYKNLRGSVSFDVRVHNPPNTNCVGSIVQAEMQKFAD